ncbi:hypothetical protein IU470_13375 [Nocardia abscessus]|uniref:Uncharacterized protein n=1 Tax=Nocardia abscessus TaxID=120957 RepID=A0ABS0C7G3_9NOCA|nr:hypothetical protein [Nocardia abscessus]MBF6226086.1 hypothetical protein [Nocardia abscessus]
MDGSGGGAAIAKMLQAAKRLVDALVDRGASRVSEIHHEFPRKIRDGLDRITHTDKQLAPELDKIDPAAHMDRNTAEHPESEIPRSSAGVPEVDANGPVMLSGRQALEALVAQYGDRIVFHGTRDAIRTLEPRQTSWGDGTGRRYPDGPPAVCADTHYDIPIFMGLFKGRSLFGYGRAEDGTVAYQVKGASTDEFSDLTAHVHVIDRKHFQQVELGPPEGWPRPLDGPRTPELRSTTEVEPFAIVKVTMADFPYPISDFDT